MLKFRDDVTPSLVHFFPIDSTHVLLFVSQRVQWIQMSDLAREFELYSGHSLIKADDSDVSEYFHNICFLFRTCRSLIYDATGIIHRYDPLIFIGSHIERFRADHLPRNHNLIGVVRTFYFKVFWPLYLLHAYSIICPKPEFLYSIIPPKPKHW